MKTWFLKHPNVWLLLLIAAYVLLCVAIAEQAFSHGRWWIAFVVSPGTYLLVNSIKKAWDNT
jgi:hypothetical protein